MENDPHNVSGRLYLHMVRLLDRLDNDGSITMRERVQAMLGLGHLLRDFAALRKESGDQDAGTAARKYESAFNDARGRANHTRRVPDEPADEPDPLDPDSWIYSDEQRTEGEHDAGGD